MDQDRVVYIVVDRVRAPYRVLLYQPGIRFSLGTNTKVSSLQQQGISKIFLRKQWKKNKKKNKEISTTTWDTNWYYMRKIQGTVNYKSNMK